MLKSPVYNDCLTDEMRQAYRSRNDLALHGFVMQYSAEVQHLTETGTGHELVEKGLLTGAAGRPTKFYLACARLQVACALYDSLRGGHATAFVTDYINV